MYVSLDVLFLFLSVDMRQDCKRLSVLSKSCLSHVGARTFQRKKWYPCTRRPFFFWKSSQVRDLRCIVGAVIADNTDLLLLYEVRILLVEILTRTNHDNSLHWDKVRILYLLPLLLIIFFCLGFSLASSIGVVSIPALHV